jgi:hypothetical protein
MVLPGDGRDGPLPNDPVARHIERSLDISEQVVVDTPAALAVSFDFGKFIEPIAQG